MVCGRERVSSQLTFLTANTKEFQIERFDTM